LFLPLLNLSPSLYHFILQFHPQFHRY
jgi:hypothetical protein